MASQIMRQLLEKEEGNNLVYFKKVTEREATWAAVLRISHPLVMLEGVGGGPESVECSHGF